MFNTNKDYEKLISATQTKLFSQNKKQQFEDSDRIETY